jgi:hypothetical protein
MLAGALQTSETSDQPDHYAYFLTLYDAKEIPMSLPDIPKNPLPQVPNSVVIIEEGYYGFVGKESGLLVALRNNGDQGFFLSRDNAPSRWIPVVEFTADAKGLLSPEEVEREETEKEGEEF